MGRLTFPKEARIRRRVEFLTLQRVGKRRHTSHMVVIRGPAAGPLTRLGVTVSRRVGNSVVRNRVKRLLREVFRQRRAQLLPPEDILVIAKPGADSLTYAEAARELTHALLPATRS